MLGVAIRYGVTLEELQTANPGCGSTIFIGGDGIDYPARRPGIRDGSDTNCGTDGNVGSSMLPEWGWRGMVFYVSN